MNTVTLSSKGQLVIPKSIRDDAQVAAGSQLEVRYLDGEIRLRPIARAPATALDDVAGCLARAGHKLLSAKQTQLAIKTRLKAQKLDMIALDTNLLARLLLKDDAAQHARVKALMKTKQVFTAPVTVFLELVWVLEANGIERADIGRGIHLLLGLDNFTPPGADAVRHALSAYMQGLDFADALHLALSRTDEALVTFDRGFVRRATRLGLAPPVSTP